MRIQCFQHQNRSYLFRSSRRTWKILAQKHINLINGAGCLGLMCRISDAALAAGGTVTGVIPRFMVEQGWHHKGLTRLIETESMHERKQLMADLSDGVIVLPGDAVHWKSYWKSLPETAWTIPETHRHTEYQRIL